MKKFILIFALLLGLTTTYAQNTSYVTAYEIIVRTNDNWSDWKSCDIDIKIDYDCGKITVYGNKTQTYTIIEHIDTLCNSSGRQIAYVVINKDKNRGQFRFKHLNNGNKQIYIDFINTSYRYNVK